jgi:glycosyltransferase involved in cell wall biosynthesis
MAELYNAADVFVIPSLEDNLPNTVSEALLCGTAVSGMRIGGIKEMVTDGVNGYLSASPEGLGDAINKTLSLNLSASDIRQIALKELEEKQLIERFEKLYSSFT